MVKDCEEVVHYSCEGVVQKPNVNGLVLTSVRDRKRCKMGLNIRKEVISTFPGKLSIDKDSEPTLDLI